MSRAAAVVAGLDDFWRGRLAEILGDPPPAKLVFKSSAHYYGCHGDGPAFFTEAMRRPLPPRTAMEADVVAAEAAVRAFADRHPEATVTLLRFADAIGPREDSSLARLFGLPVIPAAIGFDPRLQVIHADDVEGCVEHALRHDLPGTFNCAADGVLVLSEVADLLAKPLVPILPPVGTALASRSLAPLGLHIPRELLPQLRFGRALDNRRLKATGYRYRYTSREAIMTLRTLREFSRR
jgi:UDP-glucose 4-epimerase